MPQIIAVCGPDGSGKTTLVSELARRFGGEAMLESLPPHFHAYCRELAAGTGKLLLQYQLWFLNRQVADYWRARHLGMPLVFMDRLPWEHREVLAPHVFGEGRASEEDQRTYEHVADELLYELLPPDLVVLLRPSPEAAAESVWQRGREGELLRPPGYAERQVQRCAAWPEPGRWPVLEVPGAVAEVGLEAIIGMVGDALAVPRKAAG